MEKFVGFETDQDQDAFFRDARVLNPRNYNHGGRDTVADCGICYDKRVSTFEVEASIAEVFVSLL